jgi:hypothetical protein
MLAWLAIYGLRLARVLPAELQRGTAAVILAFGVVFMALAAALLTAVFIAIPLRIMTNVILKDRRRSHRSETVVLALPLALTVAFTVAYVFEVRRERSRLAPPEGVATLSAFADVMPPPERLELVHHDGRGYIAWTGALSGPYDVPSGPSCYIFNDKGCLVDWQSETGDGGPVEDFLRSSVKQKQLTLNEALRITRTEGNGS